MGDLDIDPVNLVTNCRACTNRASLTDDESNMSVDQSGHSPPGGAGNSSHSSGDSAHRDHRSSGQLCHCPVMWVDHYLHRQRPALTHHQAGRLGRRQGAVGGSFRGLSRSLGPPARVRRAFAYVSFRSGPTTGTTNQSGRGLIGQIERSLHQKCLCSGARTTLS